MKRFHGLAQLGQRLEGKSNGHFLAELLMQDLQQAQCRIFGSIAAGDQILLATLSLLTDSVNYDSFDQRLDFTVAGPILRNDCVPLTYRLQGGAFGISGRCSMIARVCGVDLYLQRSYTGIVGDMARQKFSIAIKPLLQQIKSAGSQ